MKTVRWVGIFAIIVFLAVGTAYLVYFGKPRSVSESEAQKPQKTEGFQPSEAWERSWGPLPVEIPNLINIAVDPKADPIFRSRAAAELKQHPNEQVIVPFRKFLARCNDDPKLCAPLLDIARVCAANYRSSHDQRLLDMFAEMLQGHQWKTGMRSTAVRMLVECEDKASARLLWKLVLTNPAYPHLEHRAWAARAIAATGDDSVLPYVEDYAKYILDDPGKESPEREFTAVNAIGTLASFGKVNERAQRQLVKIVEQFILDKGQNYSHRRSIFGASVLHQIAEFGGKENIALIERIMSSCNEERIVEAGIESIGEYGDVSDIAFLQNFSEMKGKCQAAIAST